MDCLSVLSGESAQEYNKPPQQGGQKSANGGNRFLKNEVRSKEVQMRGLEAEMIDVVLLWHRFVK